MNKKQKKTVFKRFFMNWFKENDEFNKKFRSIDRLTQEAHDEYFYERTIPKRSNEHLPF